MDRGGKTVTFGIPRFGRVRRGYISVFRTLQKLGATASDMRIILQKTFWEGFDEEPFIEVVGRNGTLNKDMRILNTSGNRLTQITPVPKQAILLL